MGGTQANRGATLNTNHHSRIEPAVRQSQGTSPFLPTSNHRHGRMQTSPLPVLLIVAKKVYSTPMKTRDLRGLKLREHKMPNFAMRKKTTGTDC